MTNASKPSRRIYSQQVDSLNRSTRIYVQFSGWPHVVPFSDSNTSARGIIEAMRQFFSNIGVPIKLWSDNGPQFAAAELKKFLKDWDIIGGTSSPHYAQSNGRAEVEVKTIKKLINGCSTSGSFDPDKFAKAILLFRNTLRVGGASPAQAIFNRPVRDFLPAHRRAFAAEWQKASDILEKTSLRAKDLQMEHLN